MQALLLEEIHSEGSQEDSQVWEVLVNQEWEEWEDLDNQAWEAWEVWVEWAAKEVCQTHR